MEIIPYSDKYKEQVVELVMNILENEFGHHSRSGRPDLHKISEVYQKNNGNFWIAVEGENVIGTIALSDYGNGKGYLERFFVKKELRRRGVGRKLISSLLDFAKEKNYKKIFLSTWGNLLSGNNFYIKNGFRRIESLPEEIPHSSSDNVFYELEL